MKNLSLIKNIYYKNLYINESVKENNFSNFNFYTFYMPFLKLGLYRIKSFKLKFFIVAQLSRQKSKIFIMN